MTQKFTAPAILATALAFTFCMCQSAVADEAARPKIVELKIFPERLDLTNQADARRVLVTGRGENGVSYDLSGEATFQADGAQIAVGSDSFVEPKSVGETTLTV